MSTIPKATASVRRPAPTAVQRAIQEGYGRAATEGGTPITPVPIAVDEDEHSVPVDMNHHDGLVFRLQRLEANDVELARGLGDMRTDLGGVKTDVAVIGTELKALVTYAAKADARAEKAEDIKVENERAERQARIAADAQVKVAMATAETAEANATAADRAGERALTTTKVTSREKIYLAIIAVFSAAVVGYFALSHVALK